MARPHVMLPQITYCSQDAKHYAATCEWCGKETSVRDNPRGLEWKCQHCKYAHYIPYNYIIKLRSGGVHK